MIYGSRDGWRDLLGPLLPSIISLVRETWLQLTPPAPDESEDATTYRLFSALQKHPNRESYRFRIVAQHVILQDKGDTVAGRLDLSFLPFVSNDDVYFCLECKRLNARGKKSGAVRAGYAEYVTKGMLRFVTKQYSFSVRDGGMLGYVLDGDVPAAIRGVAGNIAKNRKALRLAYSNGDFLSSNLFPNDASMKETRHLRAHESGAFVLHHMFFDNTVRADNGTTRTKKPRSTPGKSKLAAKKAGAKQTGTKKGGTKRATALGTEQRRTKKRPSRKSGAGQS